MREIFCLVLFFIIFTVSAQRVYYVSADGDGDGTSNLTPMSFSDGQSVISSMVAGETMAFKGGDEFYGNLVINNINGSSSFPITFTSYGTGSAIIKGSKPIIGWTYEGGNIWSKTESNEVYQVFKNDLSLNNGKTSIKKVTSSISGTKFICSDLIGSGDLVGASAFIRSVPWRYSVRKITAFNNSTGEVTIDKSPSSSIDIRDKVFITNTVDLLTEQGDWSYDSNANKIYMYSVGEPDNIEASTNTSNITITNSDYITIDNLKITNSNDSGIFPKRSTNLSIINNEFNYCYQAAAYIDFDSPAPNFFNNTITNSGIVGIESYSNNTTISDNNITNTGLVGNVSWKWTDQITGLAGGSAINVNGANSIVERNSITNTGYNGIDFRGANSNIKNNYILEFNLTSTDGGGIYTFNPTKIATGSSGSTIEGNIIINTNTSSESFGIYLDDRTHHIEVVGNGIIGSSRGIFFHNVNNHTIRNNNIFNSTHSGVEFGEDHLVGDGNLINNTFENNYIFSENDSYAPLLIRSTYDNYMFGVFENNKYFNPLSKRNIKIQNSKSDNYLSLKEWQTISNQDLNSRVNDFIWEDFVVDKVIGEDLIVNNDFEESINNWGGWQSNLFVESESGNHYLGSNSNYNDATVTSNTFSITKNKTYLLEFDVKSDSQAEYWLNLRMDNAPYTPFLNKTINSYEEWTHYSIKFYSNIDEAKAVLSLTINKNLPDLHLDNVKFTEVEFGIAPTRSQLVYNAETVNKTISLNGLWEDLDGNVYSGSIFLEPYASRILIVSEKSIGFIDANAGEDVKICLGESTTLNATGGSSYKWSNGATTKSITVSPDSTTTYTVTVTEGGESASDDVIVNVNAVQANAGSNITITEGDIATLMASGGSSYLWSNGATTSSISISPDSTTRYTVIVSNNGCEDSDFVDVTVNPATGGGNPVVANAGADEGICRGDNVVLTASGGSEYSWNTGATAKSITVSPDSTTTYTVTVTEGGESASDEVIVNVNEVVANAGVDRTITEGETITLVANGGDSYLWSTGEKTKIITISPNKTITYSVIAYKGNCQDSDELTVKVESVVDSDPSPANADAGEDMTICLGQSVVLNGTGGDIYEWNNGATTGQINVAPNRTTTFRLTASRGGVTNTDDVTITVENCEEDTSNHESDLAILEMDVYPNPTGGDLTIRINNLEEEANFSINDAKGSLIYSEYLNGLSSHFDKQIDLSRYNYGLYFVRLHSADKYLVKKVIVQ